MATKLVVSNRQPLLAKYGASIAAVDQALASLTAADAARGITTEVVYLDDPALMNPLGAPPVTQALDPRQSKAAIDGAWTARTPDYLLILGAPDVVPHQPLDNPVPGDEDPDVPSDLPYASSAAFSTAIKDFLGPTRVVGRLPDVAGASDPAYLVGLLDGAARFRSRAASAYARPFAVSTDLWKLSTQASVSAVFGAGARVRLSPPDGPAWTAADYNHRAHFVNCHGAPLDQHWFGEDASGSMPVAVDSAHLAGKLRDGTVAAAECCYGAELYDPARTGGRPGLCSTYLESGSCGFWGSTNISYGPESGQAAADIIAQRFLFHVRQGGSVGSAALEARLDFITTAGPTPTPVDLKTLGQFILLGDPSLHPVQLLPPDVDPASPRFEDALAALRTTRRLRFALRGDGLAERTAAPVLTGPAPRGRKRNELMALAAAARVPSPRIYTYTVRGPERYLAARALTGGPDAFHLLLSRPETEGPVPRVRILIAAEENGVIRPVNVVESR
jgi:hypothetical protein